MLDERILGLGVAGWVLGSGLHSRNSEVVGTSGALMLVDSTAAAMVYTLEVCNVKKLLSAVGHCVKCWKGDRRNDVHPTTADNHVRDRSHLQSLTRWPHRQDLPGGVTSNSHGQAHRDTYQPRLGHLPTS